MEKKMRGRRKEKEKEKFPLAVPQLNPEPKCRKRQTALGTQGREQKKADEANVDFPEGGACLDGPQKTTHHAHEKCLAHGSSMASLEKDQAIISLPPSRVVWCVCVCVGGVIIAKTFPTNPSQLCFLFPWVSEETAQTCT